MAPGGRDDEGMLRWSDDAPPVQLGGVAEARQRAVANLVLGTMTEGIWLIDTEAHTTFVNRRLADLLGYTEAEMIGKPVFAFLDRERWPMAEKNLTLRQLGLEDRQEVELIRKDGTRVWVQASANPVLDANGGYAGALAVLIDLTAQKRREQALRARVADLEARLAVDGASPYREPFRTAIVLAACGGFVATVALATLGAAMASLFGASPAGPGDLGV